VTPTFPFQPCPTLAGFTTFVVNQGIPATVIGPTSEWLVWAFNFAISTVNLKLQAVVGPQYMLAVYYLGMDFLVNWAPDPATPVFYVTADGQTTTTPWMAYLRQVNETLDNVPGVVSSTADESTSVSMELIAAYENFTIANLQQLKTPWGRAYLGLAAAVGPQGPFGLS
jgi:hypothetical protein